MYRSRRKKSTDWDDFRTYAREARERMERQSRMGKDGWAIVLGGVFIVGGFVLFMLYSAWTGFVEAQARVRQNLNVKMLDDLRSGRAELSTDTLAQFREGEVVPVANLLKAAKSDTPLHVLVAKDKLLVYDKNPEDGPGLLKSIEAASRPDDLIVLHYDPTNGTESAGHEFIVLPRK